MALDMVQVMAELGFGAFAVAGHDRGGRVGYRMALDHPAVVTRLAVLDIVPTHVMWQRMDRELAMATYHWLFLAQPDGLPETLIGADPAWWVQKLRRWASDPRAFAPEALEEYVRCFTDPAAVRLLRGLPGRGGRRRPARRRRSGPAASPARCWSCGAPTGSPAGPRTRASASLVDDLRGHGVPGGRWPRSPRPRRWPLLDFLRD